MRSLLFVSALGAVLAGGSHPAPAAAHEGEGRLEVVAADPAGAMTVRYRVRLVYAADNHPAADATVTAVAEQGGQASAPVTLTPAPQPGEYEGALRFPAAGTWTVRFTAVTPPATLERVAVVDAASTPTTPTTAAGDATTTTSTRPSSTTTVAAGDDGDGGGRGVLLGFVLIGALAVGLALVPRIARWRERS